MLETRLEAGILQSSGPTRGDNSLVDKVRRRRTWIHTQKLKQTGLRDAGLQEKALRAAGSRASEAEYHPLRRSDEDVLHPLKHPRTATRAHASPGIYGGKTVQSLPEAPTRILNVLTHLSLPSYRYELDIFQTLADCSPGSASTVQLPRAPESGPRQTYLLRGVLSDY